MWIRKGKRLMASRYSQPLVLEYEQRRFDGGTEREMIEQIEWHQRVFEQQRLAMGSQFPHPYTPQPYPAANPVITPPPSTTASVVAEETPVKPEKKNRSMKAKLYQAFIMPYVELILGLSGVLIGTIMVFSVMKHASSNADVLKNERNALIHHSWAVVRTSILGIFLSPWMALKLCIQK